MAPANRLEAGQSGRAGEFSDTRRARMMRQVSEDRSSASRCSCGSIRAKPRPVRRSKPSALSAAGWTRWAFGNARERLALCGPFARIGRLPGKAVPMRTNEKAARLGSESGNSGSNQQTNPTPRTEQSANRAQSRFGKSVGEAIVVALAMRVATPKAGGER